MTALGIGLIGTGFMGACHALAFRAAPAVFDLPPVRLAVLADRNGTAAADAARRFGFERATGDWRDLVDDPAVDVVAIAAPNALHRETALAALAAGKHVYCEKPMGVTPDDARAMAEAAAAAPGVVTLLGYNYLRSPALGLAKRLIDEGALGPVLRFDGRFDEDYMADPAAPHTWRCTRAGAGLGALGDLGSHLVAASLHLLGPIDEVSGDRAIFVPRRPTADGGEAPVENEDAAQALLRFESGARGLIATSRVAYGRKNHLAFEITGRLGTILFDQERFNELRLFRAGDAPDDRNGFRTLLTGPLHPPYAAFSPAVGHGLGFNDLKTIEVAGLLRAVAGAEPAHPDFAAGHAIERALAAIDRSAETRRWVRVPGA